MEDEYKTMAMKTSVVISVSLLIAACGNQAVYDNLQLNSQRRCGQLPPSEYEACMEEANRTFEEYNRERDDALGQQNEPSD